MVASQNIKIAVTGGYGSGKTTFIRTISDPWENGMFGPALMPDFGRITVDEQMTLYLFSTPRAQQFEFMLPLLDQMLCVVLVDSVRTETFREAAGVIAALKFSQMPYVVAANFQDDPDAWHPEDLRIALRIPAVVPVIPCAAWHTESVKDVLLTLMEMMFYEDYALISG